MVENNKNEVAYIYKRIINSETIEIFNQKLYEMTGVKSKFVKIHLNLIKYL